MRTSWMRGGAGAVSAVLALAACSIERTDAGCIALPLEPGTYRVTSPYGLRVDPILGTRSMHYGTDMGAALGTPIYAVADGEVVYVGAGRQGRSSELVVVAHEVDGQEFYSWHVHMFSDGVFVEVGDRVSAGQRIAEVGSNGRATGPHLHFEIHTADDGIDLGLGPGPGTTTALGPAVGAAELVEPGGDDARVPLPLPTDIEIPTVEPPTLIPPDPGSTTEPPTQTPTPTETPTVAPSPGQTPTPSPFPAPQHSEPPGTIPPGGTTVDPMDFLESLGSGPVSPTECG